MLTKWRIPIGAKLLTGFGIVLALTAVLAWVSITRMASIDERAKMIFEEDLESIVAISEIEEEALDVQIEMSKGVLATLLAEEIATEDPVHSAELQTQAEHLLGIAFVEAEDVTHRIDQLLVGGHLHGETLAIGEELAHNWELFLEEVEEVRANEAAGLSFAAGEAILSGSGEAAFALAITEIVELRTLFETEAEHAAAAADAAYRSARTLTIAIVLVALAAGLGIGIYLARSISRGVAAVSDGMSRIAEGQLDHQVTVQSNDELEDMAGAYAQMQGYLEEMASGADAIAVGNIGVAVTPRSDRDVLGNAFVGMREYLQQTADAATRIAEGDLTVTVNQRSSEDSLGRSFQAMIDTLSSMLGKTTDVVRELVSEKNTLTEAASQSASATTETANTVAQVAEGTTQQAQAVQELSGAVVKLNAATETLDEKARTDVANAADQMASGASEATARADDASEAAHAGRTKMQSTVDGIDRIRDAMDTASKEVASLGDQSSEIGKIVAVIDDIAAQTNLLALNAAIEAARAGEQGRGFAVVADEVRQLAERVTEATKEIASLIDGVQNGVTATVSAIEAGATEMETGTTAAAETSEALDQILTAVEGASEQIADIAGRSTEVKTASGEMLELIEDLRSVGQAAGETSEQIAAVAEQNSAATEQVSASSEEIAAQVEQVSTGAEQLGSLADALEHEVSMFRLKDNALAAQADHELDVRQAA